MPTLHITRGIPGSGKSTWANEWFAADPEHRALSNRDDIRASLFPGNIGVVGYEREKLVTKVQHAAIKSLLNEGYDVCVHDTNLRAKFVQELMRFSDDVEFHDFPIDIHSAQARNLARAAAGGRFVPPEVIVDMFQRFTPKGKLPPVPVRHDKADMVFPPYVYKKGLPNAILVDVDGTIANHNGIRHPHDTTKYHLDEPHADIIKLVNMLSVHNTVVILSARDQQYQNVLLEWLERHGVNYDKLIMRPEGDTRNDALVKNELFEKYIAGKYNVSYIFDDRDRVVEMWRGKGLRALQVAPGAF